MLKTKRQNWMRCTNASGRLMHLELIWLICMPLSIYGICPRSPKHRCACLYQVWKTERSNIGNRCQLQGALNTMMHSAKHFVLATTYFRAKQLVEKNKNLRPSNLPQTLTWSYPKVVAKIGVEPRLSNRTIIFSSITQSYTRIIFSWMNRTAQIGTIHLLLFKWETPRLWANLRVARLDIRDSIHP